VVTAAVLGLGIAAVCWYNWRTAASEPVPGLAPLVAEQRATVQPEPEVLQEGSSGLGENSAQLAPKKFTEQEGSSRLGENSAQLAPKKSTALPPDKVEQETPKVTWLSSDAAVPVSGGATSSRPARRTRRAGGGSGTASLSRNPQAHRNGRSARELDGCECCAPEFLPPLPHAD
jgi:hypothetical protein